MYDDVGGAERGLTTLDGQCILRSPALESLVGSVQIGLAENGGDPAQDGCAFHVTNLESLYSEFQANGLQKSLSQFDVERHGGVSWRVFYVVAPDGLCYWFGERQPGGGT